MKTTREAYAEQLIERKLTLGFFSHEMEKIGVYVVSPFDVVSLVFLSNESRYFPKINENDVVVGGYYG